MGNAKLNGMNVLRNAVCDTRMMQKRSKCPLTSVCVVKRTNSFTTKWRFGYNHVKWLNNKQKRYFPQSYCLSAICNAFCVVNILSLAVIQQNNASVLGSFIDIRERYAQKYLVTLFFHVRILCSYPTLYDYYFNQHQFIQFGNFRLDIILFLLYCYSLLSICEWY